MSDHLSLITIRTNLQRNAEAYRIRAEMMNISSIRPPLPDNYSFFHSKHLHSRHDPLDSSAHSVRSVMSLNNPPASLEGYGENVFKGAIAAPYLLSHGLQANILDSPGKLHCPSSHRSTSHYAHGRYESVCTIYIDPYALACIGVPFADYFPSPCLYTFPCTCSLVCQRQC